MQPGNNPIERLKAEKDGLAMLDEIDELAARHGGWETLDPSDRDRLKWIGTFFRKPTPGRFMMRIRVTGGQTNAAQLRTLADVSQRLGNGVLDLTTRQQVELRAIQIRDVPEIIRALEGVDLSSLQTGMDNIRGVTCCPLAGLTPHELFDASPAGAEYTRVFLRNKEFSNLPRKFNVAISACLENCTPMETQDLSMTPARHLDGRSGFNVHVGGKMGSGGMKIAEPLDVFVGPDEAAELAAQITLLFRDEGSRDQRTKNRLAFLIQAWGAERFRGELERRCGRSLERAQEDVRLSHVADHLGVTPQREPGQVAVGLCVPTGRIMAAQMIELARLADSYGDGQVRLTVNQNPILVNVPEKKLHALLAEPLLSEFSPDPHPFLRGLVTCTGTDYCNLALIETKRIGRNLAETMAAQDPNKVGSLRMHWSGCPAGCGNHQAADIGFQGAKARVNGEIVDAVSIFVGGRTGPDPRPAEKIMELVPVEMLDELMPVVLKHLDTLKHIHREPSDAERVLMVPAT